MLRRFWFFCFVLNSIDHLDEFGSRFGKAGRKKRFGWRIKNNSFLAKSNMTGILMPYINSIGREFHITWDTNHFTHIIYSYLLSIQLSSRRSRILTIHESVVRHWHEVE